LVLINGVLLGELPMGNGCVIPNSGDLNADSSPMIRCTEQIFSEFLHFLCPTPATDFALLYRRQVLLVKNNG
jgi:hypothetical protein